MSFSSVLTSVYLSLSLVFSSNAEPVDLTARPFPNFCPDNSIITETLDSVIEKMDAFNNTRRQAVADLAEKGFVSPYPRYYEVGISNPKLTEGEIVQYIDFAKNLGEWYTEKGMDYGEQVEDYNKISELYTQLRHDLPVPEGYTCKFDI